VNGRYGLAESPEERIAIAVVSAIHFYFQQHPQGVAPGQGFLSDFLKPFIDREISEGRLDELHRRLTTVAPRERELLLELQALRQACSKLASTHHRE
jgi:hypothetical protein